MKFLFITEYFPQSSNIDIHGGVEVRTYHVAKVLAVKHEVLVITSRLFNQPERQKLGKIEVYRVSPQRSYVRAGNIIPRLLFVYKVILTGISLGFDLVEGAGIMSWLPAFILGVIKKKPKTILVADTVESYANDFSTFWLTILKLYEKILLKFRWNQIICISKTVKNKIMEVVGNTVPIEVIYCGVDIGYLDKLKTQKNAVPTICYVGRLVPYKRVIDLITALKILAENNINFKAEIVGTGEEEYMLKKMVHRYQLSVRIKFNGFVKKHDEVMMLLKKSHIYCSPSVVEGFGISTVEALTTRIPVVLPNIPIHREITQGFGAVFFKPKDTSDLASKLKATITDQIIYKELKSQTRRIIHKYDWKNIGSQTQKLYESLCAH